MSRCWDAANFCPLAVNLLYTTSCRIVVSSRPLVALYNMSVADVRVVEFGTDDFDDFVQSRVMKQLSNGDYAVCKRTHSARKSQ